MAAGDQVKTGTLHVSGAVTFMADEDNLSIVAGEAGDVYEIHFTTGDESITLNLILSANQMSVLAARIEETLDKKQLMLIAIISSDNV